MKKEKYADDAKNMGTTFTPLVCSGYGPLHPDALATGARGSLGLGAFAFCGQR